MKAKLPWHTLRFSEKVLSWAARKCAHLIANHDDVVSIIPSSPPRGKVLLSYHRDPWVYPTTRLDHYHTNRWECGLLGDTFLEAGFGLDIIEYDNTRFIPSSDYDYVLDLEQNLERVSQHVPNHCIKIQHASTVHWITANIGELRRLEGIKKRRNVSLPSRRYIPPNRTTEIADHVIFVGNAYTAESYRYANKPLTRIPISTVRQYDWPLTKSWDDARKRFIWFGSVGLVTKGLDLVLEAFAQMPELELIVAGALNLEADFKRVYERELFHTPNIKTIGWLDVFSPEFVKTLNRCAGVVFPSSGEGGAGSVIACMHGGVVPIVTREASIDVFDFGIQHNDDSIPSIIEDVRKVADFSAKELEQRTRAAWEHVRTIHTREHFRHTWRAFAREKLALHIPEI